jgi:hypothetical protein
MFKLSPSKLNLFLECPLCFWLAEQGIHRPAGPFPSLPSGMDLAIKKYFDGYRAKGQLPPELKGKVEGKLFDDLDLLNVWRNNRKGLSWTDKEGNILMGAIDDCLFDGKNHIVIDFKTRGFELKEDSTSYYQNQLDCYALLLEKNGMTHPGFAYLIYFIPLELKEHGEVKFDIQVKKMNVDSQRALKTFNDAIKVLKGKRPARHSECKFCAWADESWKFE